MHSSKSPSFFKISRDVANLESSGESSSFMDDSA
ncbi:hypothetical protein T4B_7075 [Trichinella pseudospiralis]|uniref:Uncharacterized protein n=1 Tax=Trichinella pseudospiralis TaxID=6337 RepID=A0A0V1GR64_TRIPS|nr:hypothetical protein T4B_7075 [Trichinella pseudospiralis]